MIVLLGVHPRWAVIRLHTMLEEAIQIHIIEGQTSSAVTISLGLCELRS